MRTYLILKEKAAQWAADAEIQALVKETAAGDLAIGKHSAANATALLGRDFDRAEIASKGLGYEKLDQLTLEVLMGVR
jgi:xylose isomerase